MDIYKLFNTVETLKTEIRRLRGDINKISTGGQILPNITPGVANIPEPLEGALIYGTSTPSWGRRAIGAEGEVLTVVSGLPDWAPGSGGGDDVFTINMAAAL